MAKIVVAGEALIDFFPSCDGRELCFWARPGGSPYNVAIGLARLQVPTAYLGVISTDFFGELLFQRLREHGVETTLIARSRRPTALAFVLNRNGEPEFTFYGHNTADTQLSKSHLLTQLPPEVEALHVGSLAMARPSSNKVLFDLIQRESPRLLVSFDPNVRPQLMNVKRYQAFFNQVLSYVDILKLSVEDYKYVVKASVNINVISQWLEQGPQLVLLTHGKEGAQAFTAKFRIKVRGLPTNVVDPTGAGDAFMSAFLAALYHVFGKFEKTLLSQIDRDTLYKSVFFSVRAAEITCTRIGADPPWLYELDKYKFWD